MPVGWGQVELCCMSFRIVVLFQLLAATSLGRCASGAEAGRFLSELER